MAIERQIGGGTFYFTPEGGVEREIGEVLEGKISISSETTSAYNHDGVMKKKVAMAVKEITGKISFKTQNFSKDNLALAMHGIVETQTFAINDTLPDGTTATEETTLDVIRAGQNAVQEGSMRFVGSVPEGENVPVIKIFSVSIKPTGDISLQAEEYAALEFEGEILETTDGFFNEYLM